MSPGRYLPKGVFASHPAHALAPQHTQSRLCLRRVVIRRSRPRAPARLWSRHSITSSASNKPSVVSQRPPGAGEDVTARDAARSGVGTLPSLCWKRLRCYVPPRLFLDLAIGASTLPRRCRPSGHEQQCSQGESLGAREFAHLGRVAKEEKKRVRDLERTLARKDKANAETATLPVLIVDRSRESNYSILYKMYDNASKAGRASKT